MVEGVVDLAADAVWLARTRVEQWADVVEAAVVVLAVKLVEDARSRRSPTLTKRLTKAGGLLLFD